MEPLDYMLQVMRDPEANEYMRMQAAKAAAPYRHSRKPVALQHQNLDADGRPIGPGLLEHMNEIDAKTTPPQAALLEEAGPGTKDRRH